nr:MAG TPA: hypothetical protein [Caudoviricetes sp.]
MNRSLNESAITFRYQAKLFAMNNLLSNMLTL